MNINVNLKPNSVLSTISLFYFFILSVCFFYSPFYLFFFAIMGLLIFSAFLYHNISRALLVFLAIWSGLITASSRFYFQELDFDLSIYFDVFENLKFNSFEYITYFGGGLEIGWPLLYTVLGNFFNFTPIQLAICNSLISILIIIIWLEKKIRPIISKYEIGILYFFIFIFLNFIILGFLQRQALTIGILLFAITSKNNRNFIFFVIFASFFHLSSILVGLILYISRNIKLTKSKILWILIFSIIFRFLFSIIIVYLLSFFSIFDSIVHKLNFFKEIEFQISTLRYSLLFFSLFLILYIHQNKDMRFEALYNYAVLSAIFIISFVGVPLFADRIFMMGMIVYGLFYYLFFYKKYPVISILFATLYFLIIILERLNIIGALGDSDYYWARFEHIGNEILYYLESL